MGNLVHFKQFTYSSGKNALGIMCFENIDRNICFCQDLNSIRYKTYRRVIDNHQIIAGFQFFQDLEKGFTENQFRWIRRNRARADKVQGFNFRCPDTFIQRCLFDDQVTDSFIICNVQPQVYFGFSQIQVDHNGFLTG
ncbi:hypothetical protein D3C86_1271800 [compost metagenome]